jgi:uncharacterized protein YndB with AHSA1/START domain
VGDDRDVLREEAAVAIRESIEIARPPEEVSAYMTDPSRMTEWQESLVSARVQGDEPFGVGTRVTHVRHVGGKDRTMTVEVTDYSSPRSFGFRGIEGPIRPVGKGSIEPLEDGSRSRVTMELDLKDHGIGKLLAPLARSQARREMPRNQQHLKELLERTPT